MKKYFRLTLLIAFVLIMGMNVFTKKAVSQSEAPPMSMATGEVSDNAQIIVYYFHSTFRCVSCKNIEAYTKTAIEKYFSGELASGKILFNGVNVDEPQNKHFIKDYQLYTKAVVLSKVTDGKEEKYANLDKVWQLLRNKEKFYSYIKDETEKFLN